MLIQQASKIVNVLALDVEMRPVPVVAVLVFCCLWLIENNNKKRFDFKGG